MQPPYTHLLRPDQMEQPKEPSGSAIRPVDSGSTKAELEPPAFTLPAQDPEFLRFDGPPGGSCPSNEEEHWDLLNGPDGRLDDDHPIQLDSRGLISHPFPPSRGEGKGEEEPGQPKERASDQAEFWSHHTATKNSVAARLREGGFAELAQGLESCHSTWTIAHCNNCGKETKFPNRCDRFFCPECQPRLAMERRKSIEWWTREICQPKHVVLTVRNIPEISKAHVQEIKKWFGALRRRKFCRGWRGGFYGIEVTNERKGWHLHIHALVDAKWIDAGQLAKEWNSVNGGWGSIVKVKDCRQGGYLGEVTKYAVKGTELAKWTGYQINQFIQAFSGVRAFGVFGSLFGKRTEFAAWLETLRDSKPRCSCGSCNVSYISEAEALLRDFVPRSNSATIPPPQPVHPEFDLHDFRAWTPKGSHVKTS